jgi:hypothetical protein
MKKLFLVLGLISIATFGVYEYSVNLSKTTPENGDFELKLSAKEFKLLSLSAELVQINSNLPKQIDKNTTLNSVSIIDEVVVNNFTIINLPENLSLDTIKSEISPGLLSQICSDSLQRDFIDSDISLSMDYYDSSKELIFKLLITKKDCLSSQ